MQTTSIFYRINTVVVTLFFLVSICQIFLPDTAEARRAEGRTRTSVHHGGRNAPPRDAHRNKNMNRDGHRDRNVNRDIHRDRNVNRNVNRDIHRDRNVNVNVRGDRRYDHGGYHGGYGGRYYDDHHHHDVGGALAIGAVTGLVVGSIVTAASMPPSCSSVIVNGISYRQCGNTWYEPQYSGSQVNYIVVNSPR